MLLPDITRKNKHGRLKARIEIDTWYNKMVNMYRYKVSIKIILHSFKRHGRIKIILPDRKVLCIIMN